VTAQPALRLTLMRHAHAEAKHATGTDDDRSLDRRGLTEASEMARRLVERGARPDILLVSSALRTRQTAAPIARAFSVADHLVCYEAGLYLAEAQTLLQRLRLLPNDKRHALLIAHNPGVTELAADLSSTGSAPDFDPAAMLLIELRCTSWAALARGAIAAQEFDAPRLPFELDS
jgi:phosphohistidine phosphatase